MALFSCFVIGTLFTISIYLLLSPNLLRWLLGIALLSSSVNLLILIAGRMVSEVPPFIERGYLKPIQQVANPLPQALILTAIVIGFGLLVFALILVRKIWQRTGNVDSYLLHSSEVGSNKAKQFYE